MNNEYRFTEKEIAKIFELATQAQNTASNHNEPQEGLSLEELKHIGASTGVNPEYIVQAAATVRKHAQQFHIQHHLGLPSAISRSLPLPATFSDQHWEQLVVELRKQFGVRGTIKQDGSFREWSHGHIHVFVEPSSNGYELKLEEMHGDVKALFLGGFLNIFSALFFFYAIPGAKVFIGLFSLAAICMLAIPFLNQPRWLKKRKDQFEAICNRAIVLSTESENNTETEEKSEQSFDKRISFEKEEEQLSTESERFTGRKKTM